jgi:hypothetical protein
MNMIQTLPDLGTSYVPEGLAKLNAMQGGDEYMYGQLQESPVEI